MTAPKTPCYKLRGQEVQELKVWDIGVIELGWSILGHCDKSPVLKITEVKEPKINLI